MADIISKLSDGFPFVITGTGLTPEQDAHFRALGLIPFYNSQVCPNKGTFYLRDEEEFVIVSPILNNFQEGIEAAAKIKLNIKLKTFLEHFR